MPLNICSNITITFTNTLTEYSPFHLTTKHSNINNQNAIWICEGNVIQMNEVCYI